MIESELRKRRLRRKRRVKIIRRVVVGRILVSMKRIFWRWMFMEFFII